MHCGHSIFCAVVAIALTVAFAFSGPANAQQVRVFGASQPQSGTTIQKDTDPNTDARLLVIPVVTADSPFDPNNNLLNTYDPANANLRQDIIDKVNDVDSFWREASYGQVGVSAKVLDRYYQMPLGQDAYFNPQLPGRYRHGIGHQLSNGSA